MENFQIRMQIAEKSISGSVLCMCRCVGVYVIFIQRMKEKDNNRAVVTANDM